ncbi:MAG: GFA family protein [Alphaproteobacteria bacterium]|nr:GFA family protein [Alphaproteobacteria bacterium]MCW5739097.1 GFA family protein [Alphaproteobacteria bacterium]
MGATAPIEGGCQCGAVRYRVSTHPRWVGHCHCRMCQKAHGAAIVTWVAVPADAVDITSGSLKYYRSSDHLQRGFCTECGTPVACVPDARPGEPAFFDLALATFDDPRAFAPTVHVWCDSAMPWLPIDDHLPRFGQGFGVGEPRMPGKTG